MNTPLAYSIGEACSVARAGRTAIYEAIRDGALTARKRGRKTLICLTTCGAGLKAIPPFRQSHPQNKAPRSRSSHLAGANFVHSHSHGIEHHETTP